MPELSITDDQLRRLESVCTDLEAAFVGPYGRVEPDDALEYLLDTYSPPAEAEGVATAGPAEDTGTRGDDEASADAGGPASAPQPESEQGADKPDDLTAIDGVGEVTAAALAEAGFESRAAIEAADPAALTAAEGIGEKQAVDIVAAVAGAGGTGAAREDQASAEPDEDDGVIDAGDGPVDGDPGANSPADTLQQAMDLLDAHDDRWRESSGDEPYEVDIPDGSTEGVRTKDDVKRLLFKHWR